MRWTICLYWVIWIPIGSSIRLMVLSDEARNLLATALDRARLSARGYHKVLRVARTIADMAASDIITRPVLAEVLAYRVMPLLA